jgi:hypothetical protein
MESAKRAITEVLQTPQNRPHIARLIPSSEKLFILDAMNVEMAATNPITEPHLSMVSLRYLSASQPDGNEVRSCAIPINPVRNPTYFGSLDLSRYTKAESTDWFHSDRAEKVKKVYARTRLMFLLLVELSNGRLL